MTRADRFILFVAAVCAVVVLALFLLTFARAGAQCNCPAPWEPPTVPQPTLQPWTPQQYIAYIAASH